MPACANGGRKLLFSTGHQCRSKEVHRMVALAAHTAAAPLHKVSVLSIDSGFRSGREALLAAIGTSVTKWCFVPYCRPSGAVDTKRPMADLCTRLNPVEVYAQKPFLSAKPVTKGVFLTAQTLDAPPLLRGPSRQFPLADAPARRCVARPSRQSV